MAMDDGVMVRTHRTVGTHQQASRALQTDSRALRDRGKPTDGASK